MKTFELKRKLRKKEKKKGEISQSNSRKMRNDEESPFIYVPSNLSSSMGNIDLFFHLNTLWIIVLEFILMVFS